MVHFDPSLRLRLLGSSNSPVAHSQWASSWDVGTDTQASRCHVRAVLWGEEIWVGAQTQASRLPGEGNNRTVNSQQGWAFQDEGLADAKAQRG